jgi:hypothetical protein
MEDCPMKLRCIACEALARPVYLSAALSPHIVDVELVERGLHNQPDNLRKHLQKRINTAQSQNYDAVLLVYGLCGKATAGLSADGIPLVIPRAHDCITLFLGSRERYKDQFENNPGTYWYAHDYIERDDGSGGSLSMGSDDGLTNLESEYQEYVEKYGRDNADYLMQVMGAWKKHYQRAVYIDMNIGDSSAVRQKAQQEAERRGWTFEQVAGDLVLVRQLLDGTWANGEAEDFLVVPPGHQVSMTYDERVIGCALLNNTSSQAAAH